MTIYSARSNIKLPASPPGGLLRRKSQIECRLNLTDAADLGKPMHNPIIGIILLAEMSSQEEC